MRISADLACVEIRSDGGSAALSTSGNKPVEGRKPYTWQNAAGLRSDPIWSLPSARGTYHAFLK